jgi:hypothetical protein
MLKFLSEKKELIIDVLVLLCITLFILNFFDPKLLFLKTTINGGDTGSHYPNAVHLKEVFLPQGRIMGWMQGNYAGYPLFYHYFPLPFLLAVLGSFILPLEITFKLATVLGSFLLPFAVYFAFRALKYKFPVPIFTAVFSLPFLFNQGNSMWGGNIPSSLAGEFCYSLGLAFVFLLLGTLHQGVKEQRFTVLNAALIFLTGFSHAYTLIFSLMLGSYFLFTDFRRNYKYIFSAYSLGFLFLACWLLPVLANAPYTTSFVFRWTINSPLEVFPAILIPFMVLAAISLVLNRKDERMNYFLYLVLACVFVYIAGPHLSVLDIRFVPFFQLLLAVYSATFFADLNRQQIKASFLLPVILMILVGIWVNFNATYVRYWIKWNYSGYEQKTTWPIFSGINEYLKNNNGGRVEWEHAPADESLGSIRSSETLPYFAKRQTLEGIHMLGAISAPFVFYIESETSYQSCNPLQDYFYSTFDLKGGTLHFKLFNVSHFVVRSPQVKEAIKAFPEFRLEKKVGEYNIYRLTTNPGTWVEPLANEPVLCLTGDWRDISYQWFARKGPQDVFLAFKKRADAGDRRLFRQVVTDLGSVKKVPYPKKEIKVQCVLKEEEIEIETSEIGRPLLIKVSYHPNWRVEGADRVYLVSPSFMLVFPNSRKVRLSFEPGNLGQLANLLSLLGLLIACLSPFWFRWIRTEAPFRPSPLPLILAAVAIAVALLLLFVIRPGTSQLMVSARRAFDRGNYAAARKIYRRVMDMNRMKSGPRNEAAIFYATAFVRENDFTRGAEELRRFIADYPNSLWTPQAYFDLAHCEASLGHKEAALKIYKKIISDFPTTSWAKYSKDRIK